MAQSGTMKRLSEWLSAFRILDVAAVHWVTFMVLGTIATFMDLPINSEAPAALIVTLTILGFPLYQLAKLLEGLLAGVEMVVLIAANSLLWGAVIVWLIGWNNRRLANR